MVLIRRDEGYRRKYVKAARLGLMTGMALVLAAATSKPLAPGTAVSNQPPQPTAQRNANQPDKNEQATKNYPTLPQPVTAIQASPKTSQASDQNSDEAANWWLVRLTFGLIVVGLLQAIVFWVQATRLKETIVKMDQIDKGQTAKMTEYIAQASRSADAMSASAEATKVFAVAAQISADTAERALTILERPYVYCSVSQSGIRTDTGSTMAPDKKITTGLRVVRSEMELSVYNFGRTPARLTRFFRQIVLAMHGGICPPVDTWKEGGRELPVGTVCVKDDPFIETENLRSWFAGEDLAIATNQKSVWVIGFVRYDDILGTHHINGFALVFDTLSQRFIRRGGPEYNYERTEKDTEIPWPSSLN